MRKSDRLACPVDSLIRYVNGGTCFCLLTSSSMPNHLLIMPINDPKRKGENLRRKKAKNLRQRKKTLLKKVYELGKYDGVDIALIICQNGRISTYRLIDHESWPLSMKEIVRLYHLNLHIHTNVKAASFIPYP
jgi:SRF-type transcription factor (DNA-binding and dimerisation domain)